MKEKQNIVVICGPTASGKTGLALQLAKELSKVNILSVDSRQVYKDLGTVTGKDIPENLSPDIKIFGHDIFNTNERANLADFVRYSQKIIQDSKNTATPLIIVGGTGLYLKALTQNLSDISIPPDEKLRNKIEKLPLVDLQELLKKDNPQKYLSLNRSDLMNPRRLIRYIEISKSKPKTSTQIDFSKNLKFHWFGLLPDKNTIKGLILQRVIERINAGAVEEVKKILTEYPDKTLPIYTSLGVSQIIDFLDKKISQQELVERWTNAEIDYARRQIVWFKKQPNIVWYDKSTDSDSIITQLKKIYNQHA